MMMSLLLALRNVSRLIGANGETRNSNTYCEDDEFISPIVLLLLPSFISKKFSCKCNIIINYTTTSSAFHSHISSLKLCCGLQFFSSRSSRAWTGIA